MMEPSSKSYFRFTSGLLPVLFRLYMLDNVDAYEMQSHYMATGDHMNVVFQFKHNTCPAGQGCLGNVKRDVVDMFVTGVEV